MINHLFQHLQYETKVTGFFLVHVEISVTKVTNGKYIESDDSRRNKGNEKKFWAIFFPVTNVTNVTKGNSMIKDPLRPSHQTLERCPSGWGKGLSCCPSLRYFIKHICQNELDNEPSFLAKHEAVRPTKYLVWQRNGSKNGVPSFDYLRLVADDNIAVAVFSIV